MTPHSSAPDHGPLDHAPLDHYSWELVARDLDAEGWALLPGFFAPAVAQRLALPANLPTTVPDTLTRLEALRHALYPRLLPIARAWAAALHLDTHYPDDFPTWLHGNRAAGQTRPLSAVRRLQTDGYQPLRQHVEDVTFPLQLVALLSAPGRDFTGGEFVMTEQRPRLQSRPMVLPLGLGDAAVIAVSHRPVQGARDVYRVTARHAVSRVRSGERVGLELLLHDGR